MRHTTRTIQHELLGLQAEVIESTNQSMVGIRGRVVDETMKMLTIEVKGKERKIPKDTSVLRFFMPDGSKVEVDGKTLVARPEDRI